MINYKKMHIPGFLVSFVLLMLPVSASGEQQKKINKELTASLTPEILRQRELESMVEACAKGNTCIIDFTGGNTSVVNMVRR